MRRIKSKAWVLVVAIGCFFILFAPLCYGVDDKESENPVKTYKIQSEDIGQNEPSPLTEAQTETSAETSAQTSSQTPAKTMPDLPKEIVFVLDNSGSMKNNDPNRITKDVVTSFIKNVDPGSRLGMVLFDKDAKVLQPLMAITGQAEEATFIDSLNHLNYRGQQTNTATGIERAIYELKTNGTENTYKMIILLTDGIIDTGDPKRDVERERWLKEDLVSQCQQLGIKIFGIAFTDNADFRLMQILASKTNGEYFRVYRAEEIKSVFDGISKKITRSSSVPPDTKKEAAQTSPSIPKEKAPSESQLAADTESPPPKMPTLRTEPSPPIKALAEPSASPGMSSTDIFLTLFLIAIILAVFILLWMIYRGNRTPTSGLPLSEDKRDVIPEGRPDVQAELIDVEHIIQQDSLSLTIDKALVTVGRDPHNDIVIPEKVISSLHATITYKNGQYYLEDNRSTNGTRLNNKIIYQNAKAKLKSGDIIHFAKCEFRFLVHDQAPYGETIFLGPTDTKTG